MPIDPRLIDRFYLQSNAERWRVSKGRFAEALESSVARAFAEQPYDGRAIERYLAALHLEDVALACACAAGDDEAWEHFVRAQRPLLYRAADALEPGGGARDLADSLYGELFGLHEREGERRSLFRYFHGRSSLTTWLRTVLAQRHIDRFRTTRRLDPLPGEDTPETLTAPATGPDPDRERHANIIRAALARSVAALASRDRLRLACYYAQGLTLAQTGRLLGEHEASASRHLARTRRALRDDVERQLRTEHRLTEAEVTQCFASVTENAGFLNLDDILEGDQDRKESTLDRSR